MRKISLLFVLAALALACAACNLPQHASSTLPAPAQPAVRTAAVTPPAAGQPNITPSGSPAPDPGDVVQAYLIAYPDDTQGMLSCLSSSLKASLPAGGPGLLLQAEGDINGFVIQTGSEVPNPPQAVVSVALQAGNAHIDRTFNLIQENGLWVINSITP